MNPEMQAYLESEAAQGLFTEEGGFEIAVEKALDKLSRFALPEEGLWVAKMVQAAVACGAPEIHFTFERRQVSVEFRNAKGWRADRLLSQLLNLSVPSESALRHLFSGILGAALGFSQKIFWRCGGKSVMLEKSGPKVADLPSASEDLFFLTAVRPRRPARKSGWYSSPVRYLLRQTVQEYRALVERVRVSPIPVFIDGRRLDCSYQVLVADLPEMPKFNSENATGRGALLAQVPLSGLARPPIPYPIDSAPLMSKALASDKFRTLRLPVPEVPVEGVLMIYSCLQRRSRINFVQDGVCIQTEDLFEEMKTRKMRDAVSMKKEALVLDLYVAADWRELDLTHFKMRVASWADLAFGCLPALKSALALLLAECDKPWELCLLPPVSTDSPGFSIKEAVHTAFVAMFIPQILLLGGIVGGGALAYMAVSSARYVKDWEERQHQECVKEFQEKLQLIISRLEELEHEDR